LLSYISAHKVIIETTIGIVSAWDSRRRDLTRHASRNWSQSQFISKGTALAVPFICGRLSGPWITTYLSQNSVVVTPEFREPPRRPKSADFGIPARFRFPIVCTKTVKPVAYATGLVLGDVVEDVRTVFVRLNDPSIYIPVFYPTVWFTTSWPALCNK